MGEIKSVKVDNWGVFFLQKLQNFFNKTDYCDLTLQFNDNSQLKVHRLVLSACTDYFNVLEQTCEIIDDALIMPSELQADVVVPIVNFMYTGTLEFELAMYGKLLKTAKDMNMTVLLKLLEAHRRTMEASIRAPGPKTVRRLATYASPSKRVKAEPISPKQQQRNIILSPMQIRPTTNKRVVYYPTQTAQSQTIGYNSIKTSAMKGPTRFDLADDTETLEPHFDNLSYESKPLKQELEDEYETGDKFGIQSTDRMQEGSFEQLRQSYAKSKPKRPASGAFSPPPEKKPNIEDVKEYAEQQRMRKQIAAEYADDYEDILDDEFPDNDDDDDYHPSGGTLAAHHKPTEISVKQEPNQKPTIVVKDSTSSKVNHAKIISEVLKKYPHLIKNNKNIKLKIMPNTGGSSTQKIIVKKETIDSIHSRNQAEAKQYQESLLKETAAKSVAATTAASTSTSKTSENINQPRRIDSKKMHALIAMGAENTTGPWLCLRCGVNGRPISIPSYRGFRRHLINTHKENIDQRLCEHCGLRSINTHDLHHHMFVKHNIPSPLFVFPKCEFCSAVLSTNAALMSHMEEHHSIKDQHCIYCNKVFVKELELFAHMKSEHKEQARLDGVIDFEDEEYLSQDESIPDAKIQILSDIDLSGTIKSQVEVHGPDDDIPIVSLAAGDEQGPKFVTADGNEMVLTQEQRQEIIDQLDQHHDGDGGVLMVISDPTITKEIQQDTTEVEVDQTKEINDPAQQVQKDMSWEEEEHSEALNSSIVDDPMDEDDFDEDDAEKEEPSEDSKIDEEPILSEADKKKLEETKKEEVDNKLKMLAGDWSEDEEEEHEEEEVVEKVSKNELEAECLQESIDEKTADSEADTEILFQTEVSALDISASSSTGKAVELEQHDEAAIESEINEKHDEENIEKECEDNINTELEEPSQTDENEIEDQNMEEESEIQDDHIVEDKEIEDDSIVEQNKDLEENTISEIAKPEEIISDPVVNKETESVEKSEETDKIVNEVDVTESSVLEEDDTPDEEKETAIVEEPEEEDVDIKESPSSDVAVEGESEKEEPLSGSKSEENSTTIKTTEEIKSLISDWGDDDT